MIINFLYFFVFFISQILVLFLANKLTQKEGCIP